MVALTAAGRVALMTYILHDKHSQLSGKFTANKCSKSWAWDGFFQ